MVPVAPQPLLWDPNDEKSSCGVGFITRKDGVQGHDVIERAREALCSVPHRGGMSSLGVGDGGGVSMDLSQSFFRKITGRPELNLGQFCVGNFFLPEGPGRARATALIERVMTDRGFTTLTVRQVPVDDSVLRPAAVPLQLPITQWVFAAPSPCPEPADLDRLIQQALLQIESVGFTRPELAGLYPLSLSARTQVLKGRLSSPEVVDYFTDLADEDHRVHTLYFHTRFSTNTDPHPTMAQPFRYLAHNGELNTDKKNRIAQVTDAAAQRRTIVRPPGQSDSCRLDQTVAARVTGGASAATGKTSGASAATGKTSAASAATGKTSGASAATGDADGNVDLVTAIVSMMPPAWENDPTLSPRVRAMFEYFSLFEEKNDGPAAVVFGDGTVIGARLDRLGLRPLRTLETSVYLCAFSEAGQISVPPETVLSRGRVRAGGMIYYDHREHRTYTTDDAYENLAAARDYPALLAAAKVDLADLPMPDAPRDVAAQTHPAAAYRAYYLDQESLRFFMDPMISDGAERVSAMGFGNAINAFTDIEPSVARFFSQRFAQVTNPPLDSIREADGMTLRVALGPRAARGDQSPTRKIVLRTPILTSADLAVLRAQDEVPVATFDAVFPVRPSDDDAAAVLAIVDAMTRLGDRVVEFARTGGIAVISDRAVCAESAALPIIFAVAAINQRLVEAGLRLKVSLIADTGQVESSHHLAAVLGFGAAAVHPHSVARRAAELAAADDLLAGQAGFDRWARAAEKSLCKTMGRVGLCTVESYIGGEFFEPNFLDTADDHLHRWFPDLRSPVGGVGLTPIVATLLGAHRAAFEPESPRTATDLPLLGLFKERSDGAGHSFGTVAVRTYGDLTAEPIAFPATDPDADAVPRDDVNALPRLTLTGLDDAFGLDAGAYVDTSFDRLRPEQIDAFEITPAYRAFVAELRDARSVRPSALRDVLDFPDASALTPIALADVEPAHRITATFASGAMSHGALVAPAHEAVAHGTNMVGGLSNSGEGGEHISRYGTLRASRIKQFASGRFGIWAGYLADPMLEELEIKIGQGAKPGEGGQLPSPKVTVEIAAARGGTPGVELVSPPPHHDTYSIEDLAQLIHDCKAARVRVIVKLVSSEGIGTIAVGVAKAGADVINVAGNTGGTGAASVSSLRYAGRAAEIGLSEVHQALCANGLRQKVVLRASGAHQIGRDVVVSALLGADSFEFGTAALMMVGCVMAKNCNVKCPAGLTTNPEAFEGDPRAMAQYLCNLAHDVRETLATLGLSSLRAARGRTDLLHLLEHPALVGDLRVDALLGSVAEPVVTDPVYLERDYAIDDLAIEQVRAALLDERAESVTTTPVVLGNRNKSVGAQLAIDIERIFNYELDAAAAQVLPCADVDDRGRRYLRPDTVRVATAGSAGLSYAAFCNDGMALTHTGTCNDGVGKSMSGGTVTVRSPGGGSAVTGGNVLIGNFALFGATGGRLFVAGEAGDRFAVRNSGATAVVEGIGEYGCEYMTNGAVLNLGDYGNGLGNGMSGGFLYQYDPACRLDEAISSSSVIVGAITGVDDPLAPIHHAAVHQMLQMHSAATQSPLAARLLQNWETERHYIAYAMPRALAAYQDSDALAASIGRRALLDELSTALATDQVRKLRVSLRHGHPVAGGVVPAYGHTDDGDMFSLLNAFTVFAFARDVAAKRLSRGRRAPDASWSESQIGTAAANLVLTQDHELLTKVGRYARDILDGYTHAQLAALIATKRVDDYKQALALRNVRSMDAPATYGWILHQDRKNAEKLGALPDFDELFATAAIPDVAASLPTSEKVG